MAEFRTERDSMGEMQVPADAYYGAQTARAVENFPISKSRFGRPFIRALALVKLAAARANEELGLLAPNKAKAILQAAQEVADGKFDGEFVVDDLLATGGTASATVELVRRTGGEVIACAFVIELAALGGRKRLAPADVRSLIQY